MPKSTGYQPFVGDALVKPKKKHIRSDFVEPTVDMALLNQLSYNIDLQVWVKRAKQAAPHCTKEEYSDPNLEDWVLSPVTMVFDSNVRDHEVPLCLYISHGSSIPSSCPKPATTPWDHHSSNLANIFPTPILHPSCKHNVTFVDLKETYLFGKPVGVANYPETLLTDIDHGKMDIVSFEFLLNEAMQFMRLKGLWRIILEKDELTAELESTARAYSNSEILE
ncbi:hypothetical protein HAX54_038652 [Datura stramonium]|uniref:Uncharacterized protein n=1 Tax=Datura stramonium TaxID=4076 RepID=A0ABS8SIE8_DATST|nr:hypothetical protein [Datura stramonium]